MKAIQSNEITAVIDKLVEDMEPSKTRGTLIRAKNEILDLEALVQMLQDDLTWWQAKAGELTKELRGN